MKGKKGGTTTAKQFELFKEECEKWIKFFGLKGWRVDYRHGKTTDGARADVGANVVARVATIRLAKKWRTGKPTNDKVKKSAFHEVCELLLFRLKYLAMDRCTNDDEIAEESHCIIRMLENSVYSQLTKAI